MQRITTLITFLFIPGVLLAHETAGLPHLHPHGSEWLPAAIALALLSGCALYLFRRLAR